MASLSHKQLQEIVERDMPGYDVVEDGPDARVAPSAAADSVGPAIGALRAKYLGTGDLSGVDAVDATGPSDDDEIVVVQRRDAQSPFTHPKTVVVSGESHRVVGSQG